MGFTIPRSTSNLKTCSALQKLFIRIGALIPFLLAMGAAAGQLTLVNGDSIKGEISSINETHVVWQSDLLGELYIVKTNVKNMKSSMALKLRGEREPCYWADLEDDLAQFACDDGSLTDIPFLAIEEIVRFEGYRDTLHQYVGKLSILGSQASGNKQQQYWVVDTDVMMRHADFRHEVGLKYEQESVNLGPLLHEAEAQYSLDWFFKPQWFWFADMGALMDESRNIEKKATVGSGVGYQFWERQRSALSVELGAQYSDETFDATLVGIETRQTASWRISTDYRLQLPLSIAFFHKNKFLQSLDNGQQWEVDSETGVRMPIGKSVSADVKFEYDYDNLPPEGTVKEDAMLRFGLGYAW